MTRVFQAALDDAPLGDAPRAVSMFEYWPDWLFYAPVALYWIALGLRHGDLSLPTAANPAITAGGLCGESKSAILDLVGAAQRPWLARYAVSDTAGRPEDDLAAAERALARVGLAYPLVAKPDIGCNGTGVRIVGNEAALAAYLHDFPRRARVLLQEFVRYAGEAGLFYVRYPDEAAGRITSVTLKYPATVTGDGRRTLRALILADPRAGRVPHLFLPRLAGQLDLVPASGETVRLVFVGNHCKGSIFRDGREHITAALTERIDALARAMPDFHFGRIDLRFRSLAELRRGEGFLVIEINGAGSEATHIWDPRTRLLDAYRAQFSHYRAAFEIGRANRKRGARSAGLRETFRLWRLQKRLLAAYPAHD